MISDQDTRIDTGLAKFQGEVSLIHWEMGLVGAGIIAFLGASSPWLQVLAVADTIPDSILGTR